MTAEDFFAYLAAVAANPAYTARFQRDLAQPGLRIPLTASPKAFAKAVEQGRKVIWLHTFGERFADVKAGRPPGPPRVTRGPKPIITTEGRIPDDPHSMPDEIDYHEPSRRLMVGTGFVENVSCLVGLEPAQAQILEEICDGATLAYRG